MRGLGVRTVEAVSLLPQFILGRIRDLDDGLQVLRRCVGDGSKTVDYDDECGGRCVCDSAVS
jgi:hypothetical protein